MRKFAILFVICAVSFAAVSRSLPYSGRLTDATGTSVNDDVSISFSIYDVPTGGAALWSDLMTVTVVNGQFSVVLGDTDGDGTVDLPIGLSFDTPYFLEMTVEGETMAPREVLTPGAYSHRSVYADTADYARGMSTTEAASAYSLVTGDVYHVCAGEDLQMNGQYSGGAEPYTHLWTGDTGPLSATDIPNPAFNTSTAGVYNLLYTLTDDGGESSYQTMTVIVHAIPTPSIAASPASGGCEGEPVVLSGDGCFSKYCWNPGGPCSKVFNATESGTFEMTVIDQWGCQATVSHAVSFLAPPVANAGSNLAECYGGTDPTLGGTPAATGGTPPYFYEWTGSGLPYVSSPNAPNPTFDVSSASPGIYNVNLEVTDANGCADEDGPIVITVYDNPVASTSATSPVCPGDVIVLSGGATGGTSPYSFSWTGPSGFTSFAQNPTISGVTSANAGTYSVTVTDAHGCTSESVTAVVAVSDPPTITVNPPDQTICETDDITFSVTATGTGPLTYQWQRNTGVDWSDLSGATSSSLTLSSVPLSFNGYQHRCVVSGACSPNAISTASTLTVNASPAITSHPSSVTVCDGDDHTFSVTATGYALTYQWERNTGSAWAGITGATSVTLDLTGITPSMDGYLYRCLVTGGCSPAVTSTAASLTVQELPSISSNPVDLSVDNGDPASFGVTAAGDGITYQWQQSTDSGSSWGDIGGATSNTYNIATTTLGMNGYQFRCVVSGSCSPAATSTAATLSVVTHGSVSFTYTGSIGNWTVPAGVTSITIESWGAQGGGSLGGLGARMRGTVTVTPGETIKYLVGGQGTYSYGGGGGGGSFTTRADNSPLVIAGGGGGHNYASAAGTAGRTETTGGSVGSAAGGSGGSGGAHGTGSGGCGWYGSGGGGLTGNGAISGDGGGNSFTSGGAPSVNPSGNCVSAGLGGFGGGGTGGNGGGGGGGYSGGAGGLNESGYTGGCGGGSYNAGTAQSNSPGVRSGNGQIVITW